ncbi:hypothetical protein [Pseudomonas gingeri]|uniref:hypothetical protein n=1 Tax=Pseudomonas gingeri TaxID=117681 RepID=UPI0015A396F0|nr:hypothetical protein [Pseudomonas gingeri]NWA09693.1 hypothetical protein [Pseudomonas gingeri]
MDKISHFVKVEDCDDSVGVLRSHVSNANAVSRVTSITKQKSKIIAKRGRDAIVAALKEDRI